MSNASCLLACMIEDSLLRPLGVATQQNCRIKAEILALSNLPSITNRNSETTPLVAFTKSYAHYRSNTTNDCLIRSRTPPCRSNELPRNTSYPHGLISARAVCLRRYEGDKTAGWKGQARHMPSWQRAVSHPFVCESQRDLGDQIAILSSLVARKATFLLALILIASPVTGWRPMRAARLRTCRMPSPVIFTRSPFFKCFVIMTIRSSNIS